LKPIQLLLVWQIRGEITGEVKGTTNLNQQTVYTSNVCNTREENAGTHRASSSPSLDTSGRSLAFKLRTSPGTKIRVSVNYVVLFYFILCNTCIGTIKASRSGPVGCFSSVQLGGYYKIIYAIKEIYL
jgi:hypothetical protein